MKGSGADTIHLPFGTIKLAASLGRLPTITSAVAVDGGSVKPTISGDHKVQVFEVNSGATLTLSNLTVADGISDVSGVGGGIANDGTLTVNNSTISGNTAWYDGGGIYNGRGATATVNNSTISGNSTSTGGGIRNGGTLTVNNSTISGNSATPGFGDPTIGGIGGGIYNDNVATLKNTIVANSRSGGDCSLSRFGGTFTDGGYNLIEDGSCITSGTNSISGDPMLGDLADNGGPTQTMALQDGSPAIDAIPDGTNGCATDKTQDQRGVSRPQGSACDIGAFEVDQPPTVTINQSSGQADDPTSASTINFTAVFNEPVSGFTDGDVTLSGTAGATTAVVSGGPTTYTIAVSGMTSDGTVIASVPANAATDAGGNDNTASTSTDNTVTFIANSAPPAGADSYSTNEDTPLSVEKPGVLGNDNDPDSGDTLKAVLVSGPSQDASFALNADGSISYTPASNYNGPDSFTYKARDGHDADSAPVTVGITVEPGNDDPTANNGAASMAEDAAPITINLGDLVSDIETANANLTYNVSIDSADAGKGTLGSVAGDPTKRTFDSAENFNGTVTINYMVSDRGDPDNCGPAGPNCAAAKSASGTVTITVTPANDAPAVAVAAVGSCGTNDRSGTIDLTVNDPDGQRQTQSLTLSATSSNTALVPNTNLTFGGSGASRTLTATALSGKTGTATITLTVTDADKATGTVALTFKSGGNSNDTLTGTSQTTSLSGTDILLGQNGDDVLNGSGANDLLCGGLGNDKLSGGVGDDTLSGGAGNDRLTGGTGADRFSGGSGTDTATDFTPSQADTKDNTTEAP